MNANDVVVAMTSGCVSKLRADVYSSEWKNKVTVCTIEHFLTFLNSCNGNLHVDEASLVDGSTLLCLAQKTRGNIYLYGSKYQSAGYEDTMTVGKRNITKAMDMVAKENVTEGKSRSKSENVVG
jgi:hypothetical protein